ncbi:molybdopterin-binding/glycosyltransferase family 2 protein [Marivibrio halodurans]|uniref:Molybdopterin-binding/glycosyltransferase family 2 protein n=1 Tax=Marivibrio halodurans TaxID=2039722 RepID=A0A8J7S495_9PROT|nr:molybdopterin-binding/glycosyltransferase family 2 protein [Marivibrio halodurans]MBP5855382.1 molybdopterin-binding/glycosyltransferase family 2 protein [Marivibrio halodurans]
MRFGPTPLDQAVGAILAHSQTVDGTRFKKGRTLSAADVAALRADGRDHVVTARLDPGDVHEDEAAGRIARAACGANLTAAAPFTGRANLIVKTRGVLVMERARLDAINLIDEAVTIATLPAFEIVEAKQMAATIKIIPFAAPEAAVTEAERLAAENGPLMRVAPLVEKRVALIQTRLPETKASVLDKTVPVMTRRLATLGSRMVSEARVPHEIQALAGELDAAADASDIVVAVGASAIVDRGDVIPAAIQAAGGKLTHFGMPVDPGNLLLLGELKGKPVIGAPGCVRSPKPNGFDWVLSRLCADVPVTRTDIMRMGDGGLLKEIPSRPQPRAEEAPVDTGAKRAPRIAGLLLAAGQSRRMGETNKLLAEVAGRPMVAHAAEALAHSDIDGLTVVTGHEPEGVRAAVASCEAAFVHNPDYDQGLSASLKRGIAALPEAVDGVVVCLGDMPRVTHRAIDRLIAAFDPTEGRAICVPTYRGKRGNPVLFARRFFAEMQDLAGDAGAKTLIGAYEDQVVEVEMDDDSVLNDIDTPEALARARDT